MDLRRLSRRAFLKTAVATGAATTALWHWWPRQSQSQQEILPLQERWVKSVCLQCPAACGIMVRVVQDGSGERAVKIEGNPAHPSNQGGICPKGHIGLQILYDPDRLKGPLRRVGKRGEGKWEQISWDEALSLVTERLKKLRQQGEPHKLVIMSGRNRGQMGALIDRFLAAFGSPNHVGHSSICSDGAKLAHYLTQGFKHYAAYDWDNCNYLLSFGAGFIEAWRPTVRLLRAFGHMRRGRPIRAKIVQIETRFSVTAAKADEWIPINPGTDGALALAIAHVIVKEELYNKKFIEEHTFGFENWVDEHGHFHQGFKTLIEKYTPHWAAQITGVPEETIIRIAREFATTTPQIAAGQRGAMMQTNGIYNYMAIHALNALVGSLDVPGGVLVQIDPPLTPWPQIVQDEIAQKGVKQPRIDHAGTEEFPLAANVYAALPDFIVKEDPYAIDTLMLYYTNPAFSSPDALKYYKAFEKIPFIVSFSPFVDDSSAYADLILPDHTYLERWQDDVIYPSLGYPVFAVRQPVIKPLYDTRNTGDVLIELAHRLGGTVKESFPWKDFLELIQFRTRGIYESGRGNIKANSFEEFWQKLLDVGFWTDPPYPFGQWERVFKTPSQRFEFYSQKLAHKLEELAQAKAEREGISEEAALEKILERLKIAARGDEVFMPHYEEPRFVGDPTDYPLYLNTYKLMAHAEGRGANSPWLQEILGTHVGRRWESWVEINPTTARKLGIAEGDWVWVESPLGRVKVRAKLHPGAKPEVVNLPFERGHKSYGRWAVGYGANPNEILAREYDYLGGDAAFFSTRVRVYKATESE